MLSELVEHMLPSGKEIILFLGSILLVGAIIGGATVAIAIRYWPESQTPSEQNVKPVESKKAK